MSWQWRLVAICAAVSLIGSLFLVRNEPAIEPGVWFARTVGAVVFFMLVPGTIALFSSAVTKRWHYVFAAAFLVLLGVALLGRAGIRI